MSVENWDSFISTTDKRMQQVRQAIPETAAGFASLAKAATGAGAIDPKTKELIALAIGIAGRCDGCVGYHAKAAHKLGATRDEIAETIGVAVYMGGGPSMIYGAEALSAFDAFAAEG